MKRVKPTGKPTIPVKRVFVKNNTVFVWHENKMLKPIQLNWSPVTL